MSLPRYPKYKDSGIEWLGQVPEHWGLSKVRYACQCLDGKRIPLNAAERSDRPGEIPYWGANSIQGYVNEALFDEDLVLLGEDGAPFFDPNKPVAFFSQGKIWPNNHVHVLRPAFAETGRYITHFLNVVDYAQFIDGSTRDKLTQSSMNDIPVPWPPLPEQLAIARFLDAETAKIDALIEEQRRLIDLLKEKRQAVISHAVTKGLDPNVPLKDSGIEWLGLVPDHWEVKRVKWLVRSMEQGWSPQCEGYPAENQTEWGVLKVGCVNGGNFNPLENKLLPPDLKPIPALGLLSGDLLISRANTRELVGSAAVVQDAHPNLMLCDKLYRVRLDPSQINPRFLSLVLGCQGVRGEIELEATGASSSMLNIGQGTILNLVIPCPSASEQCAIVQTIDVQTSQFDTLTSEAERAIELLSERRSALISAAVTGQIDVRGIS